MHRLKFGLLKRLAEGGSKNGPSLCDEDGPFFCVWLARMLARKGEREKKKKEGHDESCPYKLWAARG